ncbi:MAG: DotU family type IV/VI secretion system protein [Planctomycetaceae bacterium]
MNTQLAAYIDPIFEYVIVLLERAENNQEPDPREEKQKILEKFSAADAALGRSQDWQLAKFALVAWIDEMLIYGSGWPDSSRSWWHSNMLELDLFPSESDEPPPGSGTVVSDRGGDTVRDFHSVDTDDFRGIADREFFHRAAKAAELPSKDALEVYYLAVILGFRGVYRHGDLDPEATNLPRQLGTWLRKTSASIQVGQQRRPVPVQTRAAAGANPLPGRCQFFGATLWTVVLVSAVVVVSTLHLGAPEDVSAANGDASHATQPEPLPSGDGEK